MKILHTFSVLAYKESPFLEECLKSVTSQKYPSKVIIATTTPNNHIKHLAKKYHVKIVTGKHTNIGGDFDFAVHAADTALVTVAHQDDIYESSYSQKIISVYKKFPSASIMFTDYFEIRDDKRVYANTNLKIKRLLLTPLKISHNKIGKRFALKFGNAICCPAVTFVRKNCPKEIFSSNYKCNVDWHAWEKISKQRNSFVFVAEKLMGHRISADTTTTDIINQGIRTKEDYDIFLRFWPKPIARILTRLYKNSEKSNSQS